MNFWQLIFWPGKDFGEFEEKRIASLVNDKKIVGMLKWFNGNELNAIPSKFINNVKIGDIIFVHYKSLKFLVEVVSDCKECNDTKIDGWIEIYRDIEVLSTDDKIYNEFKEINKDPNFQWNKAYKPYITPTFGEFDTPMMHYCYNKIKKERNMEELKHLLKNNHNLILTGAPGTGKTYLAKQIAKKMECSDDEIGFVQFHPSYDYTDFVEGLRPIQDENGTVGFERKDGVFKEFCKKALNSSVKHTFYSLTKKLENGYILKLLGGADANIIYKDGLIKADEKDSKEYPYTIECSKIETLMNKCKGESINGLNKIKENIHLSNDKEASYYWAVYDYIRNNINPFVFIIDEINRGEISKIIGELFFSIDPGYRGKKGKVRTQYANMQSVPNEFDEALGITDTNNYGHFYIPENVYIIGTMNDIDRSVESMDFAFRRRFAFKEIKADVNIGMLDNLDASVKEKATNRMKNLNNAISQIDGLSSAYHIGGSYFLKLNNYDGNSDEKFKKLWDYHIEGLLREYLRGNPEIEKHISKLKTAYQNDKKDVSSENNG